MLKLLAAVLTSIVFVVGGTASAQNLQGAGASLQQQQGSTQNTGTIQNQTGTTENTSGSINPFSQTQRSSLSVVSNPNQTTPSASVPPSSTLTAQNTNQSKTSRFWLIALLIFLTLVSGWLLYRLTRVRPEQNQAEPEQTIDSPPNKELKKKRKKKRKSTPGRR
jgi:beta-lactamase regulating signal transducer with metallopeptidase domain